MRTWEEFKKIDNQLAAGFSHMVRHANSNDLVVTGTVAIMDKKGKSMAVHCLDTPPPKSGDEGFNEYKSNNF